MRPLHVFLVVLLVVLVAGGATVSALYATKTLPFASNAGNDAVKNPSESPGVQEAATAVTISAITLTSANDDHQATVDKYLGSYTQMATLPAAPSTYGSLQEAYVGNDDPNRFILLTQENGSYHYYLAETTSTGWGTALHTDDTLIAPGLLAYTGKWIHGDNGYTATVTVAAE